MCGGMSRISHQLSFSDNSDRNIRDPPSKFFITRWVKNFQETGSAMDLSRGGRIVEAVQTVHVDMLQCIWKEMEYRIDTVRATRRAYVECMP